MGAAVYDPARFDDDDGKLVLRSTVSRTNEREVLDELERTTGVRYNTITLNRYNLWIAVRVLKSSSFAAAR